MHSIEKEAASELSSRPSHLAGFLTEKEVQQHKTLVAAFPKVAPTDDMGTAAPIRWQPYFRWVNSVRVNPKDSRSFKSQVIHVYQHWEDDWLYFTGHVDDYIKYGARDSDAKIKLSLYPGNQDSDDSGYIVINSLNASGPYRFGSLFIQLAIEYSLMAGYEGKVGLNSTRDSGLFYFKLGFIPVCERIFNQLKNGEQINGGEMYLPQASIEVWKSKIAANSILPHQSYIPKAKAALHQRKEIAPCALPMEMVPPNDGNEEKIKQILNGLIANMEGKTNRTSWFSHGTNKKIQKLKAIESWLSSGKLNATNEMEILCLIRDVSSIKRNPFGFFTPHSLIEFKEAINQHHLPCSEKLRFTPFAVNSLNEPEDVTELLM